MSRTMIGVTLVGVVAFGVACGKTDNEKPKDGPAQAAKAADTAPPPPEGLTPEQRVELYQACWDHFNARDEARFAPCYDKKVVNQSMGGHPAFEGRDAYMENLVRPYWDAFSDVKGTPQLALLVSDDRIVAVDLFQGTNSGPFMGKPVTNKRVGFYILHDFVMAADGPIESAATYADIATIMGQLGHGQAPYRAAIEEAGETAVVIAKDDDAERANVELAKKAREAFSAHDIDAVVALYADDVLYRDVMMPGDLTGAKTLRAELGKLYEAFPDIKTDYTDMVAAGDYVAMFGTKSGTNKGAMPDMGLKTATGKRISLPSAEIMRFEDGKIVEHWLFASGLLFAVQLGLLPHPTAPRAE